MAVKVRNELAAVALRVQKEFGDAASPLLDRAQIEAAIAAHAKAKIFSEDEHRALIRLRSQAFKSPDKKLKLA